MKLWWGSIKQWVLNLFTDKKETIQPEPTKKTRRKKAKELATLGTLLDTLDDSFSTLSLPHSEISTVHKNTAIGLRKMWVHVPHPPKEEWIKLPLIPMDKALPAMFCVHSGFRPEDEPKNALLPVFIFGVRHKKLTCYLDKAVGVHYEFGAAFRATSTATSTTKKLFWAHGWMTVAKDGKVHLHKELQATACRVPSRNPVSRHNKGRAISYYKKEWQKPWLQTSLDEAILEKGIPNDGMFGGQALKMEFANALVWWMERDSRWSVSVKRNGERVTFGVPKELTSRFFKDRDKTVKTASGATKRIIHFVREHDRDVGSKVVSVKEHIRGEADFVWNKYVCHVTAPGFNGKLSTKFTHGAEEETEILNTKDTIDISKVGKLMADVEDRVVH